MSKTVFVCAELEREGSGIGISVCLLSDNYFVDPLGDRITEAIFAAVEAAG